MPTRSAGLRGSRTMPKKEPMGLADIRQLDRRQKRLAQGQPVRNKALDELGAGIDRRLPSPEKPEGKKFDTGIEGARHIYLRADERKPVTREQRELRDNLNVSFSSKEAREDAQFASDYAANFRRVDRASEAGLPPKGRMRDSEAPRWYRDLGSEEKQVSQDNGPFAHHTEQGTWRQTMEDARTRTGRLVRHDQALSESGRTQKTLWDAGGPRSLSNNRDLTPRQNPDFMTDRQQRDSLRAIDAKYAARQAELERKTRRAR